MVALKLATISLNYEDGLAPTLKLLGNALSDRFFSPGETAGLYLHELRGGPPALGDPERDASPATTAGRPR